MIKLPETKKAFQYENDFYLTCANQRLNKVISHYELFKKTLNVLGAIIECGVFQGISLIRFATFRDMLSDPSAKKIIGFDTFEFYPEPVCPQDKLHKKQFIDGAGNFVISKQQLLDIFAIKGIGNIELIKGNIISTVPSYAKLHPELKISLLHLDCTIYEPTLIALKYFYNKIVRGGLLLLNGYSKEGILGETKAVDDFFRNSNILIQKLPFSFSPCFAMK